MKCLKLQIKSGLLGLGALLIASQVNAATVSLSPSATSVTEGDAFTITAQASGFDASMGTVGGTITLTWDVAEMTTTSTLADIFATAPVGWADLGFPDPNSTLVAGQLDLTLGTLGAPIDNFDFFSIDFVAVSATAPLSPNVNIVKGPQGEWQGGDFMDVLDVTYAGATVTVNPVPVPAAAWLFASGLIGLVGVARRKAQLA